MNGMESFPDVGRSGLRRRRFHRVVAFAAALVTAVGVVVASARPAEAIGVYVHRVCHQVSNPANFAERADFCVGFDYSGTTNGNRLRAYAKVVTRSLQEDLDNIVHIEFVRLGDGNGVISESGSTSSWHGWAESNTPLNYQCRTASTSYYNARAQFRVLWRNGGSSEWDYYVHNWRSSGTIDRACTDYDRTYYHAGIPYPPSYVVNGFGFVRHDPGP